MDNKTKSSSKSTRERNKQIEKSASKYYTSNVKKKKKRKKFSSEEKEERVTGFDIVMNTLDPRFAYWQLTGQNSKKDIAKRKAKKKKRRNGILGFLFIMFIIILLIVFISYTASEMDLQMEQLTRSYNELGQNGVTRSKRDFNKKLSFLSVFKKEDGSLEVATMLNSGDSKDPTEETVDTGEEEEEDSEPGVDPNYTDIEVPNDYWAYIKDAGISVDGNKSNITVNIDGTIVNLYDGIPKEWSANAEESHIIFYEKVENAWREGYKQVFGHEYPNKVQRGGWTNDSVYNSTSTIADTAKRNAVGVTSPTTTTRIEGTGTFVNERSWKVKGVDCVGFCPNPFMLTHEFQWEGTGSASPAYNYKWLIVLEQNGNYMYLPAVGSDAMSHMWPGACYQTFCSHESSSGPYAFPSKEGDYRNDWGNQISDVDDAIKLLESGNASERHGTTKNTTIQFKIEGVKLNKLNGSGWNFYGIICVK